MPDNFQFATGPASFTVRSKKEYSLKMINIKMKCKKIFTSLGPPQPPITSIMRSFNVNYVKQKILQAILTSLTKSFQSPLYCL